MFLIGIDFIAMNGFHMFSQTAWVRISEGIIKIKHGVILLLQKSDKGRITDCDISIFSQHIIGY